MDISRFIVKRIGLPIAEKVRGWPLSRYLGELEQSQWLSPEEIRAIQDRKLASLVDHAYWTVPFYRELFDEHGLTPQDVRSVDDLPKLPIVTKDVIRANLERMVSDRFDRGQLARLSSSGSTGEPFTLYMSDAEKARKWAGLLRFWKWAGLELGDRYVNVTGFPHGAFKKGFFWRFLERRFSGMMAVSAFDLTEGNVDQVVRRIQAFRPKALRGYASSLYSLAKLVTDKGLKLEVSAVCTTGETLFPFQRELIESCFGCRVYDGYGGEGMEVAGQCGFGNTYHVNAEDVILEVVDSDGNRCPPNREGQVVLTDLNHYSMPFIRYNIQDVAIASDRLCECGRGLPVVEQVTGRLTDIGVTPSGKVIVVHFFTGLFEGFSGEVKDFQVVQEKPDLFVISVVSVGNPGSVVQRIHQAAQAHLGQDVTVEVRPVSHIPLTKGGKRRLFISKCGMKAAGISLGD
ncbi:MAG: hypothetical protein N3B12_00690 [Armatimonadetes bacterium]|nr:hypothetical protein [Armatimonadota bacterium]